MRAALYHRVSTLDQDKSLARDELRDWATRNKARIVLDVEEKGTGANNDRPDMQRTLELARRGKLDVVAVWKLDRWGRSVLDVLATVRELVDSHGVRFVAISQGLDLRPGDAVSRMVLHMLAAVAEFERDLIRDRTKLGLARARKRGAKIGRPRVARPDVEAVRKVMLERAELPIYQQPPLERVAKRLGCSLHALREVVPVIRCTAGHDFDGRKCDQPGRVCKCGASVCSRHRRWHVRDCSAAAAAADVGVKKGPVFNHAGALEKGGPK